MYNTADYDDNTRILSPEEREEEYLRLMREVYMEDYGDDYDETDEDWGE